MLEVVVESHCKATFPNSSHHFHFSSLQSKTCVHCTINFIVYKNNSLLEYWWNIGNVMLLNNQSINKLNMITVEINVQMKLDYRLESYLNENFKSTAMKYMYMYWSWRKSFKIIFLKVYIIFQTTLKTQKWQCTHLEIVAICMSKSCSQKSIHCLYAALHTM